MFNEFSETTMNELTAILDAAEVNAAKAIAVLSRPTAIRVYKTVFKVLVLSIAFIVLMGSKALQWCWNHRQDTAVWHWCNDAIDSEMGQAAIDNVMVAWWTVAIVVGDWVEVAQSGIDRLVADVQAIGVGGLQRLGLEGVAIEVQ